MIRSANLGDGLEFPRKVEPAIFNGSGAILALSKYSRPAISGQLLSPKLELES